MRRIWFMASIAALIVIGAAACANGGAEETQSNGNPVKQEDSRPGPSASSKPSYTLSGEVTEQNGVFFVTVETDFKLTKENYGGSPVEGEGHVHFYLNESLIGPITSEDPFEIKHAIDGTNNIKLELANHDHSTFGVTYDLSFDK
ncbi:hypothetical protein D3P08_25245 [Paenibacillus nanensis]|uniref:DUF4399 domain-containing protein n=1 Tax=Paenibacillus nanensis TaxID=393251 RepID=A0A3A1UME3_9BACL|nr:hypothetical protein [Paenibacillus nanensis]RIX47330.1 hypothetical protein D3P08_25245 [Paenibacillus nanensis]